MNTIHVIEPYWRGLWRFDDERFGLLGEPFVGEANELLEAIMRDRCHPSQDPLTCQLTFSRRRFPGAELELRRDRKQWGGAWYRCYPSFIEGDTHHDRVWLCAATKLYFHRFLPKRIYLKGELMGQGIRPDPSIVTLPYLPDDWSGYPREMYETDPRHWLQEYDA